MNCSQTVEVTASRGTIFTLGTLVSPVVSNGLYRSQQLSIPGFHKSDTYIPLMCWYDLAIYFGTLGVTNLLTDTNQEMVTSLWILHPTSGNIQTGITCTRRAEIYMDATSSFQYQYVYHYNYLASYATYDVDTGTYLVTLDHSSNPKPWFCSESAKIESRSYFSMALTLSK